MHKKPAKQRPAPRCATLGLSEIPYGLTIVNVKAPESLPYIRYALTRQTLTADNKLGPPMPAVAKVLSLHAGTTRSIDQAKMLEQAFVPSCATSAEHEYRAVGSNIGFDWTCNEGLCTLLPIIEATQGWTILEQRAAGQDATTMAEGLIRIDNAAQKAKTRVMLLLIGALGQGLERLCQEYLEVSACEPNPGAELAFVVGCLGLKDVHTLGVGKIMCTIRQNKRGLKMSGSAFVSESLTVRYMAQMRANGQTFEAIGREVGLDRSNVYRGLQGIRLPTAKVMSQEKRALWLGTVKQGAAAKGGMAVGD